MASSIAAYLRHGRQVYQANMSVDGDPMTGVSAWDSLSPDHQHALLVQFYKQGPTPARTLTRKLIAAQTGVPYVPEIGADGAGATYLANRTAIAQALADVPADFVDRWNPNSAFASREEEASKRAAVRSLVRVPATGDGQTPFDTGAPAMPFVPPAPIPPRGRPATFDERFGAFGRTPSASTRPMSPFSGLPMQYLPPSVFGIPDAPDTSIDDWFAGLTKARPRQ